MAQQQRTLVAIVCLFGAVACCSAQMFDYQACSNAVRYEADRYRETLTKAGQKFTASLQEVGAQATDTSVFQKDLDRLTQSISSMADLSQGFDLTRFFTVYMENIQTVSSMMRNSMRLSLFSGALSQYIEFGNRIYGANTDFLERVTQSCMPTNRRIVLPADA